MAFTQSPEPAFEMLRCKHTKKQLQRTPKGRQPPKLKYKMYRASKNLFSHDVNEISYQSSDSHSPCLYKLPKNRQYPTYFRQNFDDVRPIGEGSFGEVFRVRCKTTGRYYAVKRSKEPFRNEFDRKLKLEEVRKHELMPKHKNCVQFIRAWEEDDYLYIQLELCKTSLEEYTLVHHELSQTMLWDILLDIALAVKHLHDHNLLHLDIKPANILVALNGIFKLGDFGLMIDISKEDTENAVDGDSKYLAPELVFGGHFTMAADIFSLGITMLELASDLDLPSQGPLWHGLRNGIFPDEHTKHICPGLLDLIKTMMTPNYPERPAIEDILTHPHLMKLMYKRRQLHYVNQMLSPVQSLFNMGCTALKTFMGLVLLPLRCLSKGARWLVTRGCINNGCVTADESNEEWGSSYSFDDTCGRRTPDFSSNPCNLFTESPNFSRIGNEYSYFNMSAPDILVTDSTRTLTQRKQSLNSLHAATVPMNITNVKRMCVSHEELHQYSDRNEFRDEISRDIYHRSSARKPKGARNLLQMFESCED
ncbi:membrane-associated tyrosine- and threonine-specific cdc2-inhibitory kinase-like isoform X2 [Periplaneta americana]|uniref:membrane-associated tyrosine- and threonine-specific cdc2-inhibitory kinase-like isoform X2 n=1 Tax=Periplaneta americana TaxID=6978 RepID=UPI0037E917A3